MGQPRATARESTAVAPGRFALGLSLAGALGACSPCAAVRADYERTLRDELVLVGADTLPASGYQPHLAYSLDPGLSARLLAVVDARAAVPALRIEPAVRGGTPPEFTGECVPRVRAVAFVVRDGHPALRVEFELRDGRWRDRVVGSDEQPLEGVVVATAPLLVLAAERPQLAVDFALSQVELPTLAEVSPQRRDDLAQALATALSTTLRVDVGTVALLDFVAVDALGIRPLGLQPGSDGGVVAEFVTNLRPVGTSLDGAAPDAAVTLHPGLLEAWLRRQSVTSAIRRTLSADGVLDPNGLFATTLDGVTWAGDRGTLWVTRWCLDEAGCGQEPIEVSLAVLPGSAVVAQAADDAAPIGGWLEAVEVQSGRLWSGFALALADGTVLEAAVTGAHLEGGAVALQGGWVERPATR